MITPPPVPALDPADTAWLMLSCAMVLLMTVALAIFYGGMVRSKNVLNTILMSVACMGVVGVVWAVSGYSLAFAPGGRFLGGTDYLFLRGVGLEPIDGGTVPHLLFMTFQGTFAVITAAIVSGAVVERMRFVPFLAFVSLWSLVVYAPICRWVWGPGGWLHELGALDFAGGTVVHVSAGAAGVVGALLVGPRAGHGRKEFTQHDLSLVLLGAGLLWFGWFGFNAGSALAADGTAALAFVNTVLAPAGALTCWMGLDLVRTGRCSAIGVATAIVVGLVVITPAAGFVGPQSSLVMGALGAIPSYYALLWRSRTRVDDSLDVAAAHGVGGLTGALLVGVFASTAWGPVDGALFGRPEQLGVQTIAVLAALAYAGVGSFALLKAISLVTPLRVDEHTEGRGLDAVVHASTGPELTPEVTSGGVSAIGDPA